MGSSEQDFFVDFMIKRLTSSLLKTENDSRLAVHVERDCADGLNMVTAVSSSLRIRLIFCAKKIPISFANTVLSLYPWEVKSVEQIFALFEFVSTAFPLSELNLTSEPGNNRPFSDSLSDHRCMTIYRRHTGVVITTDKTIQVIRL